MQLSAKTVRAQLALLKPIVTTRSLKVIRRGQNKIGELTEHRFRERVIVKKHAFERFEGAWVMPCDERRSGVILYLHGGGYTCGGMEYAVGFGAMLADKCGMRVFCPAYRLAPEDRFPAALEDALEAYLYVISKGHSPSHVVLCGDSAGGGLCYSLCARLRDLGMEMPAGVIGMSPWTDLTASGESYVKNRDVDPSMTAELLGFFADSYVDNRRDPLASPLFASMYGFPPSLVFVGGDEIMLDDSVKLHDKLTKSHVDSTLVVKPERWHGYLLYGLEEDEEDFKVIYSFLNRTVGEEKKLKWLPLDNAAKIYPAARRQNWSNVFRLSATLSEDIDREVLKSALDVTVRRFPSFAVRLRKGAFWYYLEQLAEPPALMEEKSYPLTRMSYAETRRCAFRVIVFGRRIAIEIFHSITDGNGALVFLKSLVAEYITQKYRVSVPAEHGVLGRLEEPREEELEDSFPKYSGSKAASRSERTAWHMKGTPETGGKLDVTCLELPVGELIDKAHEYGVSVNTFLTSAMMAAIQNVQKRRIPDQRRRRPIKVLVPVNLRKIFKSQSLRNFALYTTPEILPELGEYSFEEICNAVKHHVGADVNAKQMSMKIATNVNSEKLFIVRIMPLFIKNLVMKAVFDTVGERKSCLTLSNLGAVRIPEEMMPFVERFDFILGAQATAPYNCGVISYKDTVYINFIRNIKESELELEFYKVLRDMGLHVTARSNRAALE